MFIAGECVQLDRVGDRNLHRFAIGLAYFPIARIDALSLYVNPDQGTAQKRHMIRSQVFFGHF